MNRFFRKITPILRPALGSLAIAVLSFLGCTPNGGEISESVPPGNSSGVTPTPTPKQSAAQKELEIEWKNKYDETSAELYRNRNLWRDSRILNYNFTAVKVTDGGFETWDPGPVTIKVQGGAAAAIESRWISEGHRAGTEGFKDIDTIDKLFDFLRHELEAGKMLEVDYDARTGCPKTSTLIFAFENRRHRTIKITKFEIVK
jgi:hypothetical protein